MTLCLRPHKNERPNNSGRFALQSGDAKKEIQAPEVERPYGGELHEIKADTATLAKGNQTFSLKPLDRGQWKGLRLLGFDSSP